MFILTNTMNTIGATIQIVFCISSYHTCCPMILQLQLQAASALVVPLHNGIRSSSLRLYNIIGTGQELTQVDLVSTIHCTLSMNNEVHLLSALLASKHYLVH